MKLEQKLKALIVEDNPSDAELVLRELQRGGLHVEWLRVDTEEAFLAALEGHPDIILSDYSMPTFNGLRALMLLRECKQDIPLILVSGTVGEDIAVEAMKAGAADYLIKDRLARLLPAVERVLNERQMARIAQKVEQLNHQLMVAIDQAAESIVFTDAGGTMLYVNQGFETMTGYAREEVLGKNPRIIKSDRHPAEFFRNMWQTISRGKVWQGRIVNRRKDGALYEEEATITPIRNAEGKISSYVAVKRDITREQLLERQVIEAQKMEVVGQLAGGVAHDYNNILAANIIRLHMLLTRPGLDEEIRSELEALSAGEERAARLTRQLLAFSRRQVMRMQPLELNALLNEELKVFHRLLGEHIDLVVRSSGQECWINGDHGMIEQVILNLCINARDAMPKCGRLTLELKQVELDAEAAGKHVDACAGNFVCLTVEDTGCGIDPVILPRIFEPFFTTKEIGKGTGLGLSTVYGIVKQHQGWIAVESEIGKGSIFRIFLPAARKISQPGKGAGTPEVHRGTETILLVEDEASLRESIEKCLQRAGYRVVSASHGREALDNWGLAATEINLLLTDMIMPGEMDGLELATAFKKLNPKLAVLLTSGYSRGVSDAGFPVEEEGFQFLAKPYDPVGLTAAVRKSLARAAQNPG